MAATSKFKPKVSTNIIEGATPAEETVVTMTPESNSDESSVDTTFNMGTEVPIEEATTTTISGEVVDTVSTEETITPAEDNSAGSVEEDNSEDNSETAPPDPTVIFEDKDSTKSPLEKNVKVCLNVNHSCNIGGVSYHFEKGNQVNVPTSVKAILMQAGLLMPL